jgi:hypothetical protein
MRNYSIEYVDEEGDTVIKHAMLSQADALALMESFAARGISAKMYDLTPPQVDEASVTFGHGKEKALAAQELEPLPRRIGR